MKDFLQACKDYFHASGIDDNEKEVYGLFTELSLFIKEFRTRDLASGEVSRSNQFLSKMIDAFESMKHIYQYRTPRTLRTYSKIFVILVPIVYGPYFAHLSDGLALWISFIMPVLFSIVLVSLDNIQEQLENPFDQFGEDDININPEKFAANLELLDEISTKK